jgi:hypothetical protein
MRKPNKKLLLSYPVSLAGLIDLFESDYFVWVIQFMGLPDLSVRRWWWWWWMSFIS